MLLIGPPASNNGSLVGSISLFGSRYDNLGIGRDGAKRTQNEAETCADLGRSANCHGSIPLPACAKSSFTSAILRVRDLRRAMKPETHKTPRMTRQMSPNAKNHRSATSVRSLPALFADKTRHCLTSRDRRVLPRVPDRSLMKATCPDDTGPPTSWQEMLAFMLIMRKSL